MIENQGLMSHWFIWVGLVSLILPGLAFAQHTEKMLTWKDGDVYLINMDGTQQVNLSNTPNIDEGFYHVSPDRQRIVYTDYGNSPDHIWVSNIDGTNPRQLTQDGEGQFNESPTWSPDGTKIAFCRLPAPGDPDSLIGIGFDLFIMNADGTDLQILGPLPSHQRGPIAWSPDGTQIAYTGGGIELVDIATKQVTQLVDVDPGVDQDPAWSPDGSQIAFSSWNKGKQDIYVVNSDGTNLLQLTDDPRLDVQPCWSPDGTRIAFGSNREGHPYIWLYSINRDGTDLQFISSEFGACFSWFISDVSTSTQRPTWGFVKSAYKMILRN